MVMDQDGSNRQEVFPPEGAQGLDPQKIMWQPSINPDEVPATIAVIYKGDLWLLNVISGQAQQLTGDGLTTAINWK